MRHVSLALAALLLVAAPATAQNSGRPGARDRTDLQRPSRPSSRERTPPDRSSAAAPGAAEDAKPAAGETAQPAPATEAATTDEGTIARIKSFVRGNATIILSVLGALLLGAVAWIFLAGRSARSKTEEYLEPLDTAVARDRSRRSTRTGFSSTRIRAQDVKARLGSVGGDLVETDRDYALVVEEDALTEPAADRDLETGRVYTYDRDILERVAARDYDGAFQIYQDRIEEDGQAEFHGELEHAMSDWFLQNRDFDKAARILEHHVATHAPKDIDSRIYFHLGYAHLHTKTLKKSKRFFRLFIESDRNPTRVDRARKILDALEASEAA